jgi:hypothetical protein
MAHYAKINELGIVEDVNVIDNSLEDSLGESGVAEWLLENFGGESWVKTSYNTYGGVHSDSGIPLRKNYGGIGFEYDSVRNAFIPPKPFESWSLNEGTCLWDSPVPYPDDSEIYYWNEDIKNWEPVSV